MKNRAKCKLCNSIIESFHATDYVMCACGAISVDGGSAMRCCAIKWENFVRVDDEGNEIVPKVIIEEKKSLDISTKPTKKELIEMLEEMVKNVERLPEHAKLSSINHYDYCSLMILLAQIFKSE